MSSLNGKWSGHVFQLQMKHLQSAQKQLKTYISSLTHSQKSATEYLHNMLFWFQVPIEISFKKYNINKTATTNCSFPQMNSSSTIPVGWAKRHLKQHCITCILLEGLFAFKTDSFAQIQWQFHKLQQNLFPQVKCRCDCWNQRTFKSSPQLKLASCCKSRPQTMNSMSLYFFISN